MNANNLVVGLHGRITDLTGQAVALNGQITELSGQVAALNGRVEGIEGQLRLLNQQGKHVREPAKMPARDPEYILRQCYVQSTSQLA